MASTHMTRSPVFKVLADIQTGFDKFPYPSDNLDFIRCRGLVSDGVTQCQLNGCKKTEKKERAKIEKLFSEFQNMTECPETIGFYEDMEFFITYTHCFRHRKSVCQVFEDWKNLTIAAASIPQATFPGAYPSDSPPESPVSPVDAVFSAAVSPSSVDTSLTSLADGLMYDETASFDDLEGEDEYLTSNITAENGQTEEKIRLPGIGIGAPRGTRSLRDDSSILGVVQDHPSNNSMVFGTVYVFEHLQAKGVFKIGFTSRSAGARLNDRNNCYRFNTKLLYESKEFEGSKHAEKIIHSELWNYKIEMSSCEICGDRHREWFKASEDTILQTVKKIERFMETRPYIRCDGVWKLSDNAFHLATTVYWPSSAHRRNGQGKDVATGRALDVTRENAPQKTTPSAPTKISGEMPETPPRAMDENTRQESAQETPAGATEQTLGTKGTPIKLSFVTTTADAKIDFQVSVEVNPTNPEEGEGPRTMVIPMRPKPKQAGSSFATRVGRAVTGFFQ